MYVQGRSIVALLATLFLLMLAGACTTLAIPQAAPSAPLPDAPPPLPFADNPDPTQCGIPVVDNRRGVVHGEHQGALTGPIIYLYNSHARSAVTGQVYPGSRVDILLSQSNPTLDYFFVKTLDLTPAQEGWIPAPFVEVNP